MERDSITSLEASRPRVSNVIVGVVVHIVIYIAVIAATLFVANKAYDFTYQIYGGMNEYRKRCFLLQMSGADSDSYLDDIARLRNEFGYILDNSLVNEFLIAEQRLNKMTRQINASILDCINLDIDFL